MWNKTVPIFIIEISFMELSQELLELFLVMFQVGGLIILFLVIIFVEEIRRLISISNIESFHV